MFIGYVRGRGARHPPVRIEYSQPNGYSAIAHLRTDASGVFTEQHSFPPAGYTAKTRSHAFPATRARPDTRASSPSYDRLR